MWMNLYEEILTSMFQLKKKNATVLIQSYFKIKPTFLIHSLQWIIYIIIDYFNSKSHAIMMWYWETFSKWFTVRNEVNIIFPWWTKHRCSFKKRCTFVVIPVKESLEIIKCNTASVSLYKKEVFLNFSLCIYESKKNKKLYKQNIYLYN